MRPAHAVGPRRNGHRCEPTCPVTGHPLVVYVLGRQTFNEGALPGHAPVRAAGLGTKCRGVASCGGQPAVLRSQETLEREGLPEHVPSQPCLPSRSSRRCEPERSRIPRWFGASQESDLRRAGRGFAGWHAEAGRAAGAPGARRRVRARGPRQGASASVVMISELDLGKVLEEARERLTG